MAKKPSKKTAAKKPKSKARKAVAKKSTRSARKAAAPIQTSTGVARQPQIGRLSEIAAPALERLNRDEKNQLRKQLQVALRQEKDPVKRTALRRESASLLKY